MAQSITTPSATVRTSARGYLVVAQVGEPATAAGVFVRVNGGPRINAGMDAAGQVTALVDLEAGPNAIQVSIKNTALSVSLVVTYLQSIVHKEEILARWPDWLVRP